MNEHTAREVIMVRAIETGDRKLEVLSEDDRRYASRAARELAEWQASHTGSPAKPDDFLAQRSGQILKRLAERLPAFSAMLRVPRGLGLLWACLPALALVLGFTMHRITDPHRVDLLSAPLLLVIAWNLLVYIGMLLWPLITAAGAGRFNADFARMLSMVRTRLPRKLPAALSGALGLFMTEWAQLSRKLTAARIGRTLHLGAALFALGAVLSLYAQGYLSQYVAGWESTFLDAPQVDSLLSILFKPAMMVFQLQGFSLADIEALRFGGPASLSGGARWVHLYAATLLLLVILPRALLAGAAHFRARNLTRNFPIDLNQPYFHRLLKSLGGAPGTLRVLPYSFTVDEARDKGLNALAGQLLGEQARLMLRPILTYGEEPQDALRDFHPNDGQASLTAVLFSLAATPESENHGVLLDYLVRQSKGSFAVLIDESSYLERIGSQAGGQTRLADRRALWQQFCSFHKAPANFVNLLNPDARTADTGLTLSAVQ